MFRGLSSFNHGDDDLSNPTAAATPKSSKKKQSSIHGKNPYSSRGLDKFTSVLSDLEARKEKFMAKKGLNENSSTMVRFMYSDSQDWIPIVVRLREENANSIPASPKKPEPAQSKQRELSSSQPASPKPKEEEKKEKKVRKRVSWIEGEGGKKRGEWWKLRPSYYMLMAMLLILGCLVMFGRIFAICCAAVWWYLVPYFDGSDESGITRKRLLSKDYVRKMSEKEALASPGANGSRGKRG